VVYEVYKFYTKALDDIGDHERGRPVHARLAVYIYVLAYGVAQVRIHRGFEGVVVFGENIGFVIKCVQACVVLAEV